ncbi:MAG TPA: hypothetical protein VF035_05530 [Longimicrobiales bacterium]
MVKCRFVAVMAGGLFLFTASEAIEAQQQAPVRVARAVLEKYVGDYDQDGSTIRVSVSGDTLYREIPGQRVAFVPITETLFRMGPVFTAEFVVDETGGVTQVLTDGVDIEFRLPRKGSRRAPPPPLPSDPVRVPRPVLEQYVGVYEFIPGQMSRTDLRVTVRMKGDRLIRSMGEDMVLTPVSETRFRVGETNLMVEFVVDEMGVTQVMGSGWQQLLARKKPKS